MTLNQNALQEIAQKSPTSEAFFTYAACKGRMRRGNVTPLSRVRKSLSDEGFLPVPQDLLVMFRELEHLGAGKLQGDKFEWRIPLRTVGEIGMGQAPRTKEVVSKPVVKPALTPVAPESTHSLVIVLDPKRQVSINLPGMLNKDEADFIYGKLLQLCR